MIPQSAYQAEADRMRINADSDIASAIQLPTHMLAGRIADLRSKLSEPGGDITGYARQEGSRTLVEMEREHSLRANGNPNGFEKGSVVGAASLAAGPDGVESTMMRDLELNNEATKDLLARAQKLQQDASHLPDDDPEKSKKIALADTYISSVQTVNQQNSDHFRS